MTSQKFKTIVSKSSNQTKSTVPQLLHFHFLFLMKKTLTKFQKKCCFLPVWEDADKLKASQQK
jgi:hypothetical protein